MAEGARHISEATLDRYLCAILALGDELPVVRAVDVAGRLGCSKASVSMAVKQLTRQQLVRIEAHGALKLTDEGARRADGWQRRCTFFERLLQRCGVNPDTAAAEAQAIARALSAESSDAVRAYLEQF